MAVYATPSGGHALTEGRCASFTSPYTYHAERMSRQPHLWPWMVMPVGFRVSIRLGMFLAHFTARARNTDRWFLIAFSMR